jgi:hypothetical protein
METATHIEMPVNGYWEGMSKVMKEIKVGGLLCYHYTQNEFAVFRKEKYALVKEQKELMDKSPRTFVVYEEIMPEFLDPDAFYFHVPSLTFYSPLRSKS